MARQRYELWGETLRDLGILVLVFAPLDILIENLKSTAQPSSEKHWTLVTVLAILGFILIVAGVEIERR